VHALSIVALILAGVTRHPLRGNPSHNVESLPTFVAETLPRENSGHRDCPAMQAVSIGPAPLLWPPSLLQIPVRLCRRLRPVRESLQGPFGTNVLYRDSSDLLLLLQSTPTDVARSSCLFRRIHQPRDRQSWPHLVPLLEFNRSGSLESIRSKSRRLSNGPG
jgi:hypothetical protein